MSFVNMAGNKAECGEDLPIHCEGCYLSYEDFICIYHKDSESLMKVCILSG